MCVEARSVGMWCGEATEHHHDVATTRDLVDNNFPFSFFAIMFLHLCDCLLGNYVTFLTFGSTCTSLFREIKNYSYQTIG